MALRDDKLPQLSLPSPLMTRMFSFMRVSLPSFAMYYFTALQTKEADLVQSTIVVGHRRGSNTAAPSRAATSKAFLSVLITIQDRLTQLGFLPLARLFGLSLA